MFHLGAKLLLPLAYLRRCAYPNSTLVLFTDHDVVFQGGIAALKSAYAKAVAAAGGNAPLIFSAEYEPYPGELRRLYPRPAADAVFGYLNSGMWIGPAGAAMELLASMAGETGRGEKEEALWAHYLNWGALPGPAPRAFAENDQFAYAGFFVAQRFADACGGGGGGGRPNGKRGGGPSCFTMLHDRRRRCVGAGGAPHCDAAATAGAAAHPRGARVALDHRLSLFANMYHAGAQRLERGRLVVGATGSTPLVLHFNGPAKVEYEKAWGVPALRVAGRFPIFAYVDAARASFAPAARAAAEARFADVTFLGPTLRRLPGEGAYNFTCGVL